MSRTTRRTNESGRSDKWFREGDEILIKNHEIFPDTQIVEKFNRSYITAKLTGKLLSRRTALYHSDKEVTMNNAPKWYRQSLNRKLRAQQKQFVTKLEKSEEMEALSGPVFVKDASWFW